MPPSFDDILFTGPVSPATKHGLRAFLDYTFTLRDNFGFLIYARLRYPREVAISPRPKDGRAHARVVYELTVDQDMVNPNGTLHGGCAAFLIDLCSSGALAVLAIHSGRSWSSVSQALNTTFHAPAPLGATLEIINTTTSFGARTISATTEASIWDVTNKRLCMTGVHVKMVPSAPKL